MSRDEKEPDILEKTVGPDGKCVLTGNPCTCIPKSLGHWCCWSIPAEEIERRRKEREDAVPSPSNPEKP